MSEHSFCRSQNLFIMGSVYNDTTVGVSAANGYLSHFWQHSLETVTQLPIVFWKNYTMATSPIFFHKTQYLSINFILR